MGEMEAASETILGWKIGIKSSTMKNWCKNPELVKKIRPKNRHKKLFCSETGKIVSVGENFCRWKNSESENWLQEF